MDEEAEDIEFEEIGGMTAKGAVRTRRLKRGAEFYRVDEKLLKKIEKMAERGLTLQQIANCLEWSVATLIKRRIESPEMVEALDRGRDQGVKMVANALFENAMAGNLGAQIFFLKNKAGWSDNHKLEATVTALSHEQWLKSLE